MDPIKMRASINDALLAVNNLLERNKKDRKTLKMIAARLADEQVETPLDKNNPPVFIEQPCITMHAEMMVGSPGRASNAETYESRWVYCDYTNVNGAVNLTLFQHMAGAPRQIWVLQEAAMNAIARFNESCDKKEWHVTFMKTGIRYQTIATGPGGQVIATSALIYQDEE